VFSTETLLKPFDSKSLDSGVDAAKAEEHAKLIKTKVYLFIYQPFIVILKRPLYSLRI
jgi:hypothetical protein